MICAAIWFFFTFLCIPFHTVGLLVETKLSFLPNKWQKLHELSRFSLHSDFYMSDINQCTSPLHAASSGLWAKYQEIIGKARYGGVHF